GVAVAVLVAAFMGLAAGNSPAQDKDADEKEPRMGDFDVARLTEATKPSLAVITTESRGGRQGIGTGFVIDKAGLIATNLHVIGEGQGFQVEMADGRKLSVTDVFASDRFLDLAILRVDTGEQPLPPLALADDMLPDGSDVVVMGNPHGLKHSVVRGIISGRREIEGRKMVQLAIPIEPGNSGGPVLDREGRVHGVVTMKSAVTNNLGFAIEIDSLRELVKKPNPVSYANWRSIGRLDEREWKSLFGATWRQFGGKIHVESAGAGFGGRSICLSQLKTPAVPFEVGVRVKLDDEAGAAGLVFHSDGNARHYGFYPSNGNLRLTSFEGPTVYSWRVLHNAPSPHYRKGKWNYLKVRVAKDSISCFVNDELVIRVSDQTFAKGQVGLAKFRDTMADFTSFELAKEIPSKKASPEQLAKIQSLLDGLPDFPEVEQAAVAQLADSTHTSIELLNAEAEQLEERAKRMRLLATDVHVKSVVNDMTSLLDGEAEFSLLRASLLIARIDDREVDIESYMRVVERMARDLKQRIAADATDEQKIDALNKFLFSETGFHGSRTEYYHRAKRYMNRVIDDRNGLPIMLSILYMEIAARLDLKMEGVGLPGHFVVRLVHNEGDGQLIDVFENGQRIDRDRAAELVRNTQGIALRDEHLVAASDRDMVVRMLMNLGVLANERRDVEALLRYLELTIAVQPKLHDARLDRAKIRFLTGRRSAAIADLVWLLENEPAGVDLEQVRQMKQYIERQPAG
ncbi:MAG: tetratricopeptide repeat protein, partial [Pirellulaceae bacterium]|nr:tetratricopeptide repeat protein [Pirellulaceae bacterium]